MPDSLDTITVLPKMNDPKEHGHIFRLHWVLDLVTDSSRCYISLLFKNIKSGYVLIDTIPPELLSYCTVGSYFLNGKKIDKLHHPDGRRLDFTINSTADNRFVDAREAFSDIEYDLSLSESISVFSTVSKKQSCFVQQVGNTKIVIPWFVIAATYYFKSTSLRHAILSRRLGSLFHDCDLLDEDARAAAIFLKPEGNLGDAKTIARLKLNDFANQRLNQCANQLYANKNSTYKRVSMDFPVEQELTMEARGRRIENSAGGETYIVYQIRSEDSRFPFDTLDVYYEKEEASSGDPVKYPAKKHKHNRQMNPRSPSEGLVRHLLESSDKVENKNEKAIKETTIAVSKPPSEKVPETVYDEQKTGLSLQPESKNDLEISPGNLREKSEGKRVKHSSSLGQFKMMAGTLKDFSWTIKSGKDKILVQVTDYCYTEDIVCRRDHKPAYLTLKESYDNTPFNRRKCAYVHFSCHGRHVCLVEIDQEGLPSNGCSTMVLVSKQTISKNAAEPVVKGFVNDNSLEERSLELKSDGIILKTKNHPPAYNDEALKAWRSLLLGKVLEG